MRDTATAALHDHFFATALLVVIDQTHRGKRNSDIHVLDCRFILESGETMEVLSLAREVKVVSGNIVR